MTEKIFASTGEDTSPKVSVILPTHNRSTSLMRAIDSVLNQSYKDLELIVVDDASTDNTKGLVADISDPRIRYLSHRKCKGAGAARNTGINAARGEYIAFQDSDDEWLSGKLSQQMRVMESNPEVSAVFSPYVRIDATTDKKTQVPDQILPHMSGDILNGILGGSFIGTPTLLVRRSALAACGLFNEKLKTLEDWELAIRLAKSSRFSCLETPLLHAYVTKGSVSECDRTALQTIDEIINLHIDSYLRHPRSYARILTFSGNRRCLLGEVDRGRSLFTKAIKYDPLNHWAWLGLVFSLLGRRVYSSIIKLKRSWQK